MEFDALEQTIGHRFIDRDLLRRAFTHASFASGSISNLETYQRLEFLGDRVLALIVSDALMSRFPDADEGELARRLNRLVRAESCAHIAREVGLQRFVRTEDLSVNGQTRAANAVLADVCEALIAALYLDGGLDVVRTFVLSRWETMIDEVDAARRDPKTALQEWAHRQKRAAPTYEETARDGPDHAPEFEITVHLEGFDPVASRGKSKRDAQQAAALALLVREGVWEPTSP
ncbi:MAG: ribonuclease III [Pseudomonadota bacterium]